MRVAPGVSAALLAFLLGASGCTHYTLKPEAPSSMPKSSEPPLPLRVGLVLDEQGSALSVGGTPQDVSTRRTMLESKGYAFGPKLAQALRQSGLFQDVRFPMRLSRETLADVDLVISAQFGYRFNQDPLQAPKILFVVFTGLITGAVLTETSHHLAQGVLSVEDAYGRSVRSYDETADVEAVSMVSMFAEMKTMEAGPPVAADNLIAKLVQKLIDDRAAFAARRAKPARAPEPVAESVHVATAAAPSVDAEAVEPGRPGAAAPEAATVPEAVVAADEPPAAEPAPQAPVETKRMRISSAEAADELLP